MFFFDFADAEEHAFLREDSFDSRFYSRVHNTYTTALSCMLHAIKEDKYISIHSCRRRYKAKATSVNIRR